MTYTRAFHYNKSSCLERNMQNFIIVEDLNLVSCKNCIKELGITGNQTAKAQLVVFDKLSSKSGHELPSMEGAIA